jgi:eukaryotic translation initiation factor 2C
MMIERLTTYQERNNGNYPENILFYRDGVSESQFGMVNDKEIPQIERAMKNVGPSTTDKICKAKLTFLVVGKRHHARFYPKDAKTGYPNFGPGLIVASHVVAPKQFNFYLQSHDSALGTARSGHYVVFKNDTNYAADKLQEVVGHSYLLVSFFFSFFLLLNANWV